MSKQRVKMELNNFLRMTDQDVGMDYGIGI